MESGSRGALGQGHVDLLGGGPRVAERLIADDGIRVRVGLHTGECELVDGKVRGIAVHVAARVMARAEADEILCSRTVRDLVAGSGYVFRDRGTHQLKGVPDTWQIYAVEVT